MSPLYLRALSGALMLACIASSDVSAQATNYEFQLVDKELKQGEVVINVRLVDKRSGAPVSDAVIFAKRIDMSPDKMAAMKAPLEPLSSPEPGVYRFKTKLTMAGGWLLSLAAKVQGESGTVEGKLLLRANP
jgi:hypothetical protein